MVSDLVGKIFGRLTVLAYAGRGCWECRCSCGVVKIVSTSNLHKKTKSCGCLKRELNTKRLFKHGHAGKTDSSVEYHAWAGIIGRCYNPKQKKYKNYGARGIKVCDRWRFVEAGKTGFELFLQDLGRRPNNKNIIDRYPNNNGDYEPSNCRWATWQESNNNRRDNRMIHYQGKNLTLAEIVRVSGTTTTYRQVWQKIKRGASLEKALD